jgi:hypothetical protein
MKNLKKRASSHEDHPRCRITEDDGSRDLLFRSQMHVDEQDEEPWWCSSGGGERLDALVAHGCSLLLIPWWPHAFIGKTCLVLQYLVTD